MPDNTTEIAAIRAALNAGRTAYTVEGQSVTLSLPDLRKRLRDLVASDTTGNETVKRRIATRIDLSGF